MNEYEIRKFIDVIHPDNELFEIRVIDGKKTFSGYFTDSLTAYNAIKDFTIGNIYIVFNKIKDACYSRQQRDTMIMYPKTTTSDSDVSHIKWLLIDIDPIRPSDCNSSNVELKAANVVASMVGKFLKERGFSDPLYGMSGNGFHFIYRVDANNTPENQTLIKNFLSVLSMTFTTDMVSIDTSVFSPAQLTKLLGTVSRKGTDKDEERPQRASKLLHVPSEIKINDIALVKKIADMLPEPEKPSYHNNYGRDTFDIDNFLSTNGIGIARDFVSGGVRKIVLNECPFDHNHKSPDAALFVTKAGAIGFRCLHNSCQHYTWKDFRMHYQPDAYAQTLDYTRSIRPTPQVRDAVQIIVPEKKEMGSKFLQLHEVKGADRSKIVSIPSGITAMDKRIIGLNKGETSLISGTSGCGKSTLVNQIALNAVQNGFKCSIWSGELTASRMKNWIHLQAAGKQFTTKSSFGENSYYVKSEVGVKIDEWLKGKLYLYNNEYGNKFNQLIADMKEHIIKEGVDLIVLDNLMAMDILMLEGDRNQQQTRMIIELTNIAKSMNVHLVLIAHPRKVTTFLRKNDISGTADLPNAVDNVFIVHRVNNDFVRTAGEFYGNNVASAYFTFSNVVEVCKNRDCGIQDEMYGLFFEIESKRFLNERHETIIYGWNDMYETREIEYSAIYRDTSIPSKDQIISDFESEKSDGGCPF